MKFLLPLLFASFLFSNETNIISDDIQSMSNNIKSIYYLNQDIMIEIDAENKEINQLIDKDMCKIESIRNFKHNIYIKYYINQQETFIKTIKSGSCN